MKLAGIALLLSLTLPQSRVSPKTPQGGAWCCLCMCNSHDETKCSRYCIIRQNGKRIIEEPEMIVCTRKCEMKFKKEIK